MKKLVYFLLASALLTSTKAWAQPRCSTDEMNRQALLLHPEIAQYQLKIDSIINRAQFQRSDDSVVYTIPIVFHIIHNYGPEDISDAQVYDEMRILNEDYRKMNPDTTDITDGFKAIAGDTHIQFVLANRDPFGNVTNGIERIQSLKTYLGTDASKLDPWPDGYYLNVWVVSSIGEYVPGGEVLGYAYFPGTVTGLSELVDGVLMVSNAVGSVGTGSRASNYGQEFFRTLTHEIGHTMSLYHPWGNNNACGVACGSCGILDVPETAGYFSVCDTGNVQGGNERCIPGTHENVQNYMDYSGCACMFTTGQITEMRSILASDVVNRDSLWSPDNLAFTGISNNPPTPWTPKADFFSPNPLVCMGDSVELVNMSYRMGGTVIYLNDTVQTIPGTGINWVFDNSASPSSTTDSIVRVVFSTPGWHSVSLLASNAVGTDTLTKTSYIYVTAGTAEYSQTYSENFEDQNRFNNDWVVLNAPNDTTQWKYNTTAVSPSGNGCVMITNFGNVANQVNELISPSIDLSGDSGTTQYLYFSYSGATTANVSSEMTDSLKLLYSNNCGQTWKQFGVLTGPQLVDGGGYDFNSYTPINESSWRVFNTVVPKAALYDNVRFQFQFKLGSNGNNFYLDNVNISSVSAGVNNVAATDVNMVLFPNPSSASVQMVYELAEESPVKMELYDAVGRMVNVLADDKEAIGSHQLTINNDNRLPDGLYIVRMTVANQTISKRLVIAK